MGFTRPGARVSCPGSSFFNGEDSRKAGQLGQARVKLGSVGTNTSGPALRVKLSGLFFLRSFRQ